MSPSAGPGDSAPGSDSLLEELVDEVTNRLQRGETVDIEAYERAHPERADQIRKVLTTLQAFADLRSTTVPDSQGGNVGGPPPQPLGQLGDYRIVREVGRGGMGIVYEAVQVSLNRPVALKILPFASALDERRLQRFKQEALAAARLHHTNIVPVFGVGTERGVHFYAMQYIEGQSLAVVLRDLRQSAGIEGPAANPADGSAGCQGSIAQLSCTTLAELQAAIATDSGPRAPAYHRSVGRLGKQAAEALEYAHQAGVIHRDIKPGNLLVDGKGTLWIADFGLARLQSDTGISSTGDLLGTLRYMSPEQALGTRGEVGPRTDIYALGATLYELLTLRPAFAGVDRLQLIHQIANVEPVPPRRFNAQVPPELETIVLKALSKQPEDRYATAQELADDLDRFLRDQPIRARRPTLWHRARKLTHRHRALFHAALAFLVIAAFGLAFGAWLIQRERELTARERQAAELERSKRREQEQAARDTRYVSNIQVAYVDWRSGQTARMAQFLDAELPAADEEQDRRGFEWYYLFQRLHEHSPLSWQATSRSGTSSAVYSLAFSPVSDCLATAGVGLRANPGPPDGST
jgi:serine/threonine protein kinase